MDEALKTKILEVLGSQHLMTIATIRPDGFPQATIVNYVHDDLVLYFATDATSQKAGNISLNNKVSAAIADETGQSQQAARPVALGCRDAAHGEGRGRSIGAQPFPCHATVEAVRRA